MNLPTELRLPPHSIEAEQSVLGGLLLDNQAWDRVSDLVADGDFYRDEHKRIFRQIRSLLENDKPVDVVTVAEALDATGEGERTGGLAYLGELAANTPSVANIRRYAEIVRERSIRRNVIKVGDEISALGSAGGADTASLLENVTRLAMGLADAQHAGREPQTIDAILPRVLTSLQARVDKNGDVSGLPTGFADLDRLTCGLHPGNLTIIAGRPSMGKSTLATNISENVAISGGVSFVISLEMSCEELTERSIARFGTINTQALRSGDLTAEDYNRVSASLARLTGKRLIIADDPNLANVARIRIAARKIRQQHGRLDVVVIDFLQLCHADGANRNEQLGAITRGLKLLARELKCPIILLSQLSREVEKRPDKRPMMSDLRESGAIEQDADVILMMYRDEYYKPDGPYKGLAEALIRKNRMGPLGEVPLVFQGQFSRFLDVDVNVWRDAQEAARNDKPMASKRRGFDE